ncbi:MAG: aldo/keto reductase [Halioglobus sp.]|nr:aldo/keto reductase [Halioglobus sp.]
MLSRRQCLQLGASLLAGSSLGAQAAPQDAIDKKPPMIYRAIPGSGELLPVIGMGTSRTFDTQNDPQFLANLTAVMKAFFDGGGKVIDSSPMYGNAELRVGDILRSMTTLPPYFAATKVWTVGEGRGIAQMEESARLMDVKVFDLIAVHNLKDWQTQLATLKRWKNEGRVRYIGVTTSHGRNHPQIIDIMRNEPLDFVQFSYSLANREAENALLPLAQGRGIATMINRPFQRGELFSKSRNTPLPDIAAELDCKSWGQFYLKFILSNPAVTCIIPATSSPSHMADNMGANFGRVPDDVQRAEMIRVYNSLS